MDYAVDMIDYINNSPSPFHAVHESIKKLVANGFEEVKDSEIWKLKLNGKYFVTRNHSSIIAFTVGGSFKCGNGFTIMAAHTDSPVIKIKPISAIKNKGFSQTSIECYGGGIWHSWFDRDLKIAGRVFVKTKEGRIQPRLLHLNKPIARIPNICIHMQREMGCFSRRNAILSSAFADALNETVTAAAAEASTDNPSNASTGNHSDGSDIASKHSPSLIAAICRELEITREQLLDFELNFSDYVPATIGGVNDEFIFSPRLDNQHSCYCAIKVLVTSSEFVLLLTASALNLGHLFNSRTSSLIESLDSVGSDSNVRMIALFDNEEVGSNSPQGAGSAFIEQVLLRICDSREYSDATISPPGDATTTLARSMPKSFLASVDMAHAVHPNYADKHEERHRPELHKGPVIKVNTNQKYATTAYSIAIIRQIAGQANVPLQDFMVRQDTLCGGTVGPILATKLNLNTVDMGAPQFSMHSIREMCDITCVKQSVTLYKKFFEKLPEVLSTMEESIK